MQPSNQRNKPNKQEKKVLSDLLFKYLPYWPVFAILMVISLAGAWFYLRITPVLYEATATIMVTDESKGTEEGQMIREIDALSGKKIIENEVEVLKSKTLMRDVVRNLHLYASYHEEGDMMPKPAYITSPVTIEAANPDAVRRAEKVLYSFSEKDSQVVIGSKRYPLNQFVGTDYGNLRFIPNKQFMMPATGQLYFSLMNPRVAALGFSSKLKIEGSRVSTVITLNFRDPVPERAEHVLDELINVYNKACIEDKKRLASSTLKFVEDRMREVGDELRDIEKKSETYRSTKGAVDIGQQGELYLRSTSENDRKLGEVTTQLTVLDGIEKYLSSGTTTGNLIPSTLGLSDPGLLDLLNKLTDKELQYEKLRKSVGELHPMLTSIKSEMNNLIPKIRENIRNQRSNLKATQLNLNASNNTYSAMLQTIPQKEKDLIQINREQNIKNTIYSFLQQKKEASELSVQAAMTETRVVDRAQSLYYPVSPKKSMIYMVAIMFSLALPVGFISLKGMLNRKIIFRQEIENLISFPIIGEIMQDKSKDPVVIKEGKRTFIAEQFRRIRTSLAYLGVNHAGKKRVLVTSSVSGEGKSFVALNLALSLAMTGKKVVLIELDLANPSLSKKLDVQYEQGVSNYLWEEVEPEEIIKRTAVNSNLFFLPAGPLPDNPSELLMSERLKDLLNYLEDIFDHVIIDSAPASLLTDAYVLSPMCHATLYVVKHKYTPKVYLERLEQENSVNQLSNVGVIFNGIRSRGFTKNGYGYGYGYGYIHDSSGNRTKRKVAK